MSPAVGNGWKNIRDNDQTERDEALRSPFAVFEMNLRRSEKLKLFPGKIYTAGWRKCIRRK